MPDYIVTVCRTAHGFRDFRVNGANSAHEAKKTAEYQAANHLFSEKSADYSVEGVVELERGQVDGSHLQILNPGHPTKPTLK